MANTVNILGDDAVMDSIITKSITEITDDTVINVGRFVFYKCASLASADFPNVTSIGGNAFNGCSALTTANFPNATSIGKGSSTEEASAFSGCSALTTANFPLITIIPDYSFLDNTNLKTVNFPKVSEIYTMAFRNCTSLSSLDLPSVTKLTDRCFIGCTALETVILRNTAQVCTLGSVDVFGDTPIASGTGYVYVPKALVDQYKAAANWSTYASQIRAIEDYPEIPGMVDYSVTSIAGSAFKGTGIVDATFPNCTSIGNSAFESCNSLIAASFPVAKHTGYRAFYSCATLTVVNFPAATDVSDYSFTMCTALTVARFPAAKSVGTSAFQTCSKLTTLDFSALVSLSGTCFAYSRALTALILRSSDIVCTANWNSLNDSSIASGTCYIYVPRALVDSYKTATNWSTYAAQFRALEDYTVDGTTTGELDESKI